MLTRLALWYLLRKTRRVDQLLYLIKRICMVILTRTEQQRSVYLANKIMDDVSMLVRNQQRKNGRGHKR